MTLARVCAPATKKLTIEGKNVHKEVSLCIRVLQVLNAAAFAGLPTPGWSAMRAGAPTTYHCDE